MTKKNPEMSKNGPTDLEAALKLAGPYVQQRFHEDLDPKFLFHNFAYAEEMADKAEELGRKVYPVKSATPEQAGKEEGAEALGSGKAAGFFERGAFGAEVVDLANKDKAVVHYDPGECEDTKDGENANRDAHDEVT